MKRPTRVPVLSARMLGAALLLVLLLPVVALVLASSPSELAAGVQHPLFAPALWLSLRTTLVSLAIVVLCGTPLAYWLATAASGRARAVELLVELPVVMPPAVLGVALLQAFGREGLLGPVLGGLGLHVAFSSAAVVIAQVVVSAPFFLLAAANAFRRVDPELMAVARTLGATPLRAFVRVAVPVALPGLLAGAALCWARAFGEFGATLLFASNLSGATQTLPLAVYAVLESDVRAAAAIALLLAAVAVVLLFALRSAPGLWSSAGRGRAP